MEQRYSGYGTETLSYVDYMVYQCVVIGLYSHVASSGCIALQLFLASLHILVEQMHLRLEEMEAGPILVVSGRGIPLCVSATVQRLPIQFGLHVVDV